MASEALKLSKLLNKVTTILPYGSSFVAVMKTVIDISAVFKRKHSVHFFLARIVDIVDEMGISGF